VAGSEPILAGVAGRYATALFDLAKEAGSLEVVEGELNQFRALVDKNPDLARLVDSPAFSIQEKSSALDELLKKAGVGDLTGNFLGLVCKNNRLFAVRDIVGAFNALLSSHRGEVRAEVTSAAKLSGKHRNALVKTLEKTIGKDIKIDTKVDPEILGGLIVKVGSRMIDNSLRTKLNNLRTAMKEVS